MRLVLSCLIKPFITAQWREKMLLLIGKMTSEVPCYLLYFDKSGEIEELLKQLKE